LWENAEVGKTLQAHNDNVANYKKSEAKAKIDCWDLFLIDVIAKSLRNTVVDSFNWHMIRD